MTKMVNSMKMEQEAIKIAQKKNESSYCLIYPIFLCSVVDIEIMLYW